MENEQNIVTVETSDGVRIIYKQIAGLIARRIVFTKHPGDKVDIGERIGLMKFGSRMDVLLGPEWNVIVEPGQRGRGRRDLAGRKKVDNGPDAPHPVSAKSDAHGRSTSNARRLCAADILHRQRTCSSASSH